MKNKNMRHKKSDIVHKVGRYSGNYFTSECGSAWGYRDVYELTNDEITCKRCLHNINKELLGKEKTKIAAQRAKMNVEAITHFKTSDGMMFEGEDKAYDHEECLEAENAELYFDKYVNELLDNSEEEVLDHIHNNKDALSKSIYTSTDFYRVLWELFSDHGDIVEKALKKFKELKK